MVTLTIEQVQKALTRGAVDVRWDPDGTIVAVKVAPFNESTYQDDAYVDVSLSLLLEALIGSASEGSVRDRPWPGSWWTVYDHHIWHAPEED